MSEPLTAPGGATDPDLRARLETDSPPPLPTGRDTAIFCSGVCFHRHQRITELGIAVDGAVCRATAFRMPRLDVFRALHPSIPPNQAIAAERDAGSDEDPEINCYRSGFWMTVPIAARDEDGQVELRVVARLADGSISEASVGAVDFTHPAAPPTYDLPNRDGAEGLIAICMATYEPNGDLFRAQVESIRAQTDRAWICLVSDDCSRPERLAEIEEVLAGDPRFVLLPSDRRRGFYRNFERLLGLVPAEAELIALCDHDDRWYPDKLEALRAAVGGAQLAFSDQRLVDVDGRVLSESFWRGRRNNHTDLTSMMVANTITGSASIFRRTMLEVALPFPDIPGWQFHDHWLALVALATGRIAYVDRPLYDYVQHIDAVLGKLVLGHGSADEPGPPKRSLRGLMSGWRADHFCGYLQTEVQAQMLLARCDRQLTPPKRRALKRMVASAGSPFGLARLWVRPLRRLYGRNETLGGESQLVRGILWRHIVKLRSLRRERPGRSAPDASAPPCGAYSPDLKRLRRWRTPARLVQS